MAHCKHEPQYSEKDIPDLTGYVAIVTGGNSGIGYQTALQLALRNARVYIASRSKERVDKAISEMEQSSGVGFRKLDVRFMQLDLQDLRSVKASARTFCEQESRLDILINNAGIMAAPYKLTGDGYESQWQVNYLSPFVLTSYLMPVMLSTAARSGTKDRVRVINLSSDIISMFGPKRMLLEDVNMNNAKGFQVTMQRYAHSKQGSIRHAKELNDRYSSQGVTAYSVHPGIIPSNLQSSDTSFMGTVNRVGVKLMAHTTPLEGALNSLYCATSPEAPKIGQGKYFIPVGKLQPKWDMWLNDREGNAHLWQHSEDAMRRVG